MLNPLESLMCVPSLARLLPRPNQLTQTRQDIADHATFVQMKWQEQTQNFQRECGIWGDPAAERRWRLDFTEGDYVLASTASPADESQDTVACGRSS
mgnify:FL=1